MGTLMSCTDQSEQRLFKSNTPIVWGFQQVPSQNRSFNDQSGCECITMPVGSVSLGPLSKMPV